MNNLSISYFDSSRGRGMVAATAHGLCSVHLPGDHAISEIEAQNRQEAASDISREAAGMLTDYFKGIPQPFEKLPIDLSLVHGGFRRAVLEFARTIRFGEIRTYGQLAAAIGSPHAARAIGGAMAANPVPVIIPCHRVVASDGRLTGYSAPGGIHMKHFLLRLEGVDFTDERVKIPTGVIHK